MVKGGGEIMIYLSVEFQRLFISRRGDAIGEVGDAVM